MAPMKTALVTGASQGIGEKIAFGLAEKGYSLILVARNETKLQNVQRALASKFPQGQFSFFSVDLTLAEARKKLCDQISDLDVLVNNAGKGDFGNFLEIPFKNHMETFDLNCTAPTDLIYRLLPKLLNKKGSTIINISSLAAFQPMPYFSLYAASKAYLSSLSVALDYEFSSQGLKIIDVCPGGVRTEFMGRSGMGADLEANMGKFLMTPDGVAKAVVSAVTQGGLTYIPGFLNKFSYLLQVLLPKKILRHYIAQTYRRYLPNNGARR